MAVVSDEVFARCLIQIGAATPEQVKAAQDAQSAASKAGQTTTLAEVLIQRGIITPAIKANVEKKAAAQPSAIQQLGKYKLIKKLGEGGMGVVYLAEDTDMQRKVALKVLPKKYTSDAQSLTRFKREAHAAGKLNHDNIVGAYDAGEDGGHHFYVMEYCEGEPLNVVLKREKSLALDKALGIVIQVAQGLKHAHDHGFIHRDIKPANIFMTRDGVAKILDLGLTKELNDSENSFATQTGVALGTPHYISPEQAKGKQDIDGRTDIYSLGATYYHLITGQTPFSGATSAVIMSKHLSEQLPNPQDIREDVPDGVAHVIGNMMAKECDDRYRNCGELLEDLEKVRAGEEPSSKALDAMKTSVAVRAKGARKFAGGPASGDARRRRSNEREAITREPREGRETAAKPAPNNQMMYIAGGAAALIIAVVAVVMSQGQRHPPPPAPKPDLAEAKKKEDEAEAQRLAAEKQRAAEDARLKAEQARLDEERRKLADEKLKIEEERRRAEAAKVAAQHTPVPPPAVAAPPVAKTDVVVKTEPAAPPAPPAKAEEPKTVAPAAVTNTSTQKVEDTLAECFALLAKGQTAAALASAKKDSSADAQAVVRVLERGQHLRTQAIDNMIKNPPTETVEIAKLKVSGTLTSVDAKQALIKVGDAGMSVSLSQLPNSVFIHALGLNEAKPEGLADKATYLFANGDMEQAKTLIGPLDKAAYADLHACLEIIAKIDRQKQFEIALSDAEKNIGNMDAAAALNLVQTLTQKFAAIIDTQKERMDKLAARAQGKRAVVLLKQAFSGEVLKADDNYNVEVRYDAKKGKDVWKDFELGDNWQIGGEGPTATSKQMAGKNLTYTPKFQPGTLRVDMLLLSGFHDIFLINLGNVHAKARWFGDGNILMTYEPKYSKDVNDGPGWPKPQSFGGLYRYVVERTPESTRFLIEDKEVAKIPLPASVKTEGPATISLWSWGEVFVKEFTVKGAVDPEWLKAKAKAMENPADKPDKADKPAK